jgi:AcrR family transcriptional regulator
VATQRAARGGRENRQEAITPTLIIETATAIIANEGIDAFTMRRLGAELGVTPTAIYWHVRTRDDILRGVMNAAAQQIEIPAPDAGAWDARAAELCRSIRRAFASHPYLFPLSGRFPARGAVRLLDAMIGIMRQAGFEAAEAADAAKVLQVFSTGFAFVESQNIAASATVHQDVQKDMLLEWIETAGDEGWEMNQLVRNTDYDALFERSLADHLDALRRQRRRPRKERPGQIRNGSDE